MFRVIMKLLGEANEKISSRAALLVILETVPAMRWCCYVFSQVLNQDYIFG